MNKVTERAIEYMIRPIKSYTGNGLLEQIRRVDEFQLSLFFLKFFILRVWKREGATFTPQYILMGWNIPLHNIFKQQKTKAL